MTEAERIAELRELFLSASGSGTTRALAVLGSLALVAAVRLSRITGSLKTLTQELALLRAELDGRRGTTGPGRGAPPS